MFTRKALVDLFNSISDELILLDIVPERVILFGSYAKETIKNESDVDIAIWHRIFSGFTYTDLELIRPIIRKHRGTYLDIKFYPSGATAENFDPFIEEIEKTGKVWDIDY